MRGSLIGFGLVALALVGCSAATEEDSETSSANLTSVALPACQPMNACEAAPWHYDTRGWKHTIESTIISNLGDPHHRGRDMFFTPGETQRVHAKFTYSIADKDLYGEEIDVFVQRDCASGWEKLGTTTTTHDGDHATVDAVEDNGGRIYFEIPDAKKLGPGRHRIRSVVAGVGTYADSFLDIVPAGTPIIVSDVDGTLTSSENAEYMDLLLGKTPTTHDGAPEAFSTLAAKGYRVMYLTARPEILTSRTREFLKERGFPAGIVHTSSNTTGAGAGDSAATYKTAELALLKQKGLVVEYAFGNRTTDSDAYATVVADPQHRIFYQLASGFVGREIQSYTQLLPELQQDANVCQ
jgi:phosphatidate phosphatase PAH1